MALPNGFFHHEQRIGHTESDAGNGTNWRAQGIVGFVVPTGYSFNLDGSTLHLATASVFVAQAAEATTGQHMGIGQQITMRGQSKKNVGMLPSKRCRVWLPRMFSIDFPNPRAASCSFLPASDPK